MGEPGGAVAEGFQICWEVLIEKHGDEVVLRPVTHTQFRSFTEIARHLAEKFPDTEEFPEPPPRPSTEETATACRRMEQANLATTCSQIRRKV